MQWTECKHELTISGYTKRFLENKIEPVVTMTYNEFIKMYKENGVVWISKKLNVAELLDNDDTEKLEQAVKNEDAFKFNAEDFNKDFIIDLEKDLAILQNLK